MDLLPSLGRSIPRKTLILAAVVLVLISSSVLYRSEEKWRISNSFDLSQAKPLRELSKAEWIQAAHNTEIDRPADISPVIDLCKRTTWREGLVFQCTRVRGGIGNVKNIVLTCLRYAIEAGATGFVIPTIDIRSETELIETATGTEDFEYLLDRAHFITAVQRACPQIHIYDYLREFEKDSPSYSTATTRGKGVGGEIYKSFTYTHAAEWKGNFDAWLQRNVTHAPSQDHPILVAIDWAMFEWPIAYETVDFVNAFGQMVRNQRNAVEVSAHVLYRLAQLLAQSGIELDPRNGIRPGMFYGAHLRTDSDASMQGWQSYEIQSLHYLQHAVRKNLTTIYITSGTLEHVERFKKTAMAEYGITVVYKDMLLEGEELAQLNALSWDQRGIVDYEVLLKASALGGIDMSSFSLNLGIRRHGLTIPPDDPKGWTNLSNSENLTISDGLSEILHDPRDLFNIWLGMWP